MKSSKEIMQYGIDEAFRTMRKGQGGPFGACIVKDHRLVACASNTVIRDNDPTAHAEINAIRQACEILGTYDLSGCILHTTSEPCPMCLSAIMWANIDTVYYGCTAEDAGRIGFRDDFIYDFIRSKNKNSSTLKLEEIDKTECMKLFNEYKQNDGTIY